MRGAPIGRALARRESVTENEVLVIGGGRAAKTPDDILEITLVAAFPHAHKMGVDPDPQRAPLRMYFASNLITSSKAPNSPKHTASPCGRIPGAQASNGLPRGGLGRIFVPDFLRP